MQGVKEFFGDIHIAAINYGSNFSARLPTVIPYGNEHIIVTESENTVAKFKIGIGGVIAEKEVFSFPELNKLLLPAVPYIRHGKRSKGRGDNSDSLALYTVHSGNELRLWWQNEQNKIKFQPIKTFESDIAALIPGTVPVVVFGNGSSLFICDLKPVSDDGCLLDGDKICDVRLVEKDQYCKQIDLVLVVKDKNGQKTIVVKSYSNRKLRTVQRTKDKLPEHLIFPSSGCMNVFMKQQPNRSVSVYKVETNRLVQTGNFTVKENCKILNFGVTKNGNDFIFLVQCKDEDRIYYAIQIYEIEFSILVSEFILPEILQDIQEFGIFDDYIFIANKTNLVIVSVMARKLPIADMIEMSLDDKVSVGEKNADLFDKNLTKVEDNLKKLIEDQHFINERLMVDVLEHIFPFYSQPSQRGFVLSIIEHLITIPFNHDLMKKEMSSKNFSMNDYFILIDHLLKLNAYNKSNILNWFILLIDVHHMLLISKPSDDVHNRFEAIQNYVENYSKSFQKLEYISMVIDSVYNNETGILEAITRSDGLDDGLLSNREDYRIDRLRFA